MSVKRYYWDRKSDCDCEIVEQPDGAMVDYDEHASVVAALEARCAALAAENAGLKAFGDKLYSMYKGLETSGGGFHDEQSIAYQQAALDAAISAFEEIKTTETDAYLAELLAQGVESFAESQKEYARKNRNELDSMTRAAYCGSAVDAERFAAANPATVLALLDELEAAEKRIAELEVREVNFSLPAELTVEDCDVLARPIEYGTGWNLAISSCEEKFIHALNAAGIRINREG